jgi:hypothetical protein
MKFLSNLLALLFFLSHGIILSFWVKWAGVLGVLDLTITGFMFLGFAIIGMSRTDEIEQVKEAYESNPY